MNTKIALGFALATLAAVWVAVATAGELDITRKGRYVVFDPASAIVSEHNEVHVAIESAAACSEAHNGIPCNIVPPSYSVSSVVSADCPDCPSCPPTECPDCPPSDCADPLPPIPDPPADDLTVTINWDHPTSRENGDAITVDELSRYELCNKTGSSAWMCADLPDLNPNLTNPPSYTYPSEFAPGVWDFRLRVFDLEDLPSEWSRTVTAVLGDNLDLIACEVAVPSGLTATYLEQSVQFDWAPHCGTVSIEQWQQAQGKWVAVLAFVSSEGSGLIPWESLDSTRTNSAGQCGFRARNIDPVSGDASNYSAEVWSVPPNGECSL